MTQPATNSKIDYIQNALQMNFSHAAIAKGLGMTESAISQLVSTYNIKSGAASQKVAELDDKFDDLEVLAADKLKRALMVCDLDPVRLSAVLARVNGLRRRSQGEGMGVNGAGQAKLVNLALPQHVHTHVNVTLSAQNQVIEIEGRTVATIDKNKLHTLKNVDVDNLFELSHTVDSLPATTLLEMNREQQLETLGARNHEPNSEKTIQTHTSTSA